MWLAHDSAPPSWLVFATVSLGWIAAVCLHEFGHARVAYAGGDDMTRERGYLTLNPLKYLHPLWSLVLPMFIVAQGGIGLPGAAVYIHTSRLRGPAWASAMSFAGPAMTFAVLVIAGLPFLVWQEGDFPPAFWAALGFFVFLQATGVVFNLLPVPGLDGFGILSPWLPAPVAMTLRRLSLVILTAFIAVVIVFPESLTGVLGICFAMTDAFAIERYWIGEGFAAYRFWDNG